MKESSSLRWIAFMRPAVGLFAFVHKEIDLKKMFMPNNSIVCGFEVSLIIRGG